MNEISQGFQTIVDNEGNEYGNSVAEGFERLYEAQNSYFSEQRTALNSTTLLTALATMPGHEFTQKTIDDSRGLLEAGEESMLRSKLATQRIQRQLAGVGRLANETAIRSDPKLFEQIQSSYNVVMQADAEKKARIAIEEEAVAKIKDMALSDPVQARILMDNLEFGTADQTNNDFNIKMAVLRQRAEELDSEYQAQGWGSWLLNMGLNLFPTNYNFQRTGIVGTAGLFDALKVGSTQQKESNSLWQQAMAMSNEDFAEFASKDGPLMQSVRDNATTVFDLTDDPGAALEIVEGLMATDESTKNWNNVWGGVEVASILPWGKLSSVSKTLTGVGARREAVRNLANALDTMDAAGPEVMTRATGVTERELVDELATTSVSGVDDGNVPLGVDVADHITAARQAADELFNSPEFARMFNAEEIQAMHAGRMKEIQAQYGSQVKDIQFNKVNLSAGQTTTEVTFTIGKKDGGGAATEGAMKRILRSTGFAGDTFRDGSGQWFAKVKQTLPEAGWMTGKLEPPQMGFVGKMLGRWFLPASSLSDPTLHGMALEAGSYLNRANKVIDNQILGIYRDLPKQSRDVVRSVTHLGNLRERWFTENEFHGLVERQWGRRATDAEINAYKDMRLFNDMDYVLRNDVMYLNKLERGQETVTFKSRWGEEFDDVDVNVDYGLERIPVERVYDASRNKHYVHGRNPLDTKTLTTMKNNGYVMMTFDEGFHLPEGIVVNKVLIKKTDLQIKPLKREQLAYAPGGHRMYTDRVFVKQGRQGVQADTKSKYLKAPLTFRTAADIAEGKNWALKMNEARLAVKENRGITSTELDEIFGNDPSFPSGEEFLNGVTDELYDLDLPFEAVFDRELPSMYNVAGKDVERMFNEDELGINGYYRTTGRMYTSTKGDVLRDTKGNIAEVLDPYDTLSKSLSNVTRQLGLFAYKENALQRFGRTYADYLDIPFDARNPAKVLTDAKVIQTASPEIRNQIEAQREAIKHVLRFEDPITRESRQMYQSLAENVLGDGTSKARKAAHDAIWWWKDNNPLGSLRGLAFDMKLGLFNPGQLLVQSSTMLSALALSPKYGWLGMSTLYPMHAYILKGGSEAVLDAMTKRGVWKVGGFSSPDEFKEYARHAYRHGFMEMNGSHIMVNNYGPNAHFGSFADKQNRAREQARVFFYTSETWNRLTAYRIAWGEAWDKGLRPNNPEFNATVLKRADDYSFNMANESAARWQKGLWSIPTQFWAYNARMMEAMFGKKFTGAQRARLIGMNLGVAGTAGIPGLQAVSEYFKQKEGASPDIESLKGILDRGLIDYANYEATGNDILLGERLGTGGWASDVVKSAFGASEYGEQSLVDLLGGATWSISKNTSKTLWNLSVYAAAESGTQEGIGELTKDNVIDVFKEVSTFGNAAKAIMIYQHGILKSNSGTILASDLPDGNAVYQALSFRPAKADELGHKMAWIKDREEARKDFSKQLRNWRQEALTTGDYETYWKKANILMQMIPYEERAEVLKSANRTMDKSFYDYVDRKVEEERSDMINQEESEQQ